MTLRHAFALQSQHVENVGATNYVIKTVRHRDGPMRDVGRQQRRWRNEHDLCPKHAEGSDVAARHATVLDVADDGER